MQGTAAIKDHGHQNGAAGSQDQGPQNSLFDRALHSPPHDDQSAAKMAATV